MPRSTEPYLDVAVDIGGTFTDVVGWDGSEIHVAKVATRPQDLAGGVTGGVDALLRASGHTASAVRRFIHSTTIATNAVLERKGASVGLLATEGFEDVLEIGRQKRSRMYDLFLEPETPVFLAPGRRRAGIPERIDAEGQVLLPLSEAAVVAAVTRLVEEEGIEAIAVCYLFSFRNPIHEQRTRDLVEARFPGIPISLSSEIDPVFREYERTCATAFDAYVRPVVVGYLERLEGSLGDRGVVAPIEMMQSRGGIASFRRAVERPVSTLLCGPAAGALGGKIVGRSAGFDNLITLDVGGTSTDVAIVRNGELEVSRNIRIDGFPLRVPMVGVHTIGAGGGSIAHVDAAGALKVGPESAGAEPGAICYGRGGTEVTVTDASLALGYLHPNRFADGLRLDEKASSAALEALARDLAISPLAAALGIHTVTNAAMTDAIRVLTVERGYDPRDFTLVLLGGAGPVHGGAVAAALAMDRLIVPPRPGVLAAEGLLHARIEAEAYRTFAVSAEHAPASNMAAIFSALEDSVVGQMEGDGIEAGDIALRHSADMRYLGQSYEIEVPLSASADDGAIDHAVAAFCDRYRRLYGHGSLEDAVEFVNLRIIGEVAPAKVEMPAAASPAGDALLESRPVCFDAEAGPIATPFYRREALAAGTRLDGPAIIVQPDTTTVLRPGHGCHVDQAGNLIITLNRAS